MENLWFVTFVTHNSRVSERMVTYGVKRGEAVIFDKNEMALIEELINNASKRHSIRVDKYKVMPDHVHMIIAAEDVGDLRERVRKIKGYSSYSFQRKMGWEGEKVWAQKFHYQLIENEKALAEISKYIQYNHLKHADQWDLGEENLRD